MAAMPPQMPPGGSPAAADLQPAGQNAPMMPPQEAMSILQKFGISPQDLPTIQAAIESVEAAGIIGEAPEAEGEMEGPPGGAANAQLAQLLAG